MVDLIILPTTTITPETLLAVSHLPKTVIGDSPKLLHDSKCGLLKKDAGSSNMCHELKRFSFFF